ncbi:MAG: Holliday junction resolvase RuvX [Candidatus Pacebacteria bacterium]|nr:Holliday junction resolvase RuvX [Candidatus Paceibacterota bacterium]
MRLLGIDFGSKRVGIALSDEAGMMAFPHGVLLNDADLVRHITTLVESKSVTTIVIGESLGRDGEPNPIHAQVEEFVADMTLQVGIPIEFEPEQYTTQEAIRVQGRNAHVDASAAAIILNSYITRHKTA